MLVKNLEGKPPPRASSKSERGIRYFKHYLRMLSANKREFPSFICIGAMKAGTSSLAAWLFQHPNIQRPIRTRKEINYFDIHYQKGLKWYQACFPTAKSLHEGKITGDISPGYLFHPNAAKRISEILPDAKIIVLLRNPVNRAISHYFHEIRHKNEDLDILKAFETEESRIAPELDYLQNHPDYSSPNLRRFSYKQRGHYSDQIQRFFQYFPKKNFLIIKSEDLFQNPEGNIKEVYKFLNVDFNYIPLDVIPRNVNKYPDEVPNEVITYLKNYFSQHNSNLDKLLNRKFNW